MTRSIEDISKDLAIARERKRNLMYSNASGLLNNQIAKMIEENALLDQELFRLEYEKEKWIKGS